MPLANEPTMDAATSGQKVVSDAVVRPKQRAQDRFGRDLSGEEKQKEKGYALKFPEGMNEAFVLAFTKKMESGFQGWSAKEFQSIDEMNKLYENIHIGGTMKIATFLPIPASVIDTDVARRGAAMFGRDKVVDAIPNFLTQDNERSKRVEDLINQTIVYQCRTAEKGMDAIKGQAIEGTGIGKSFWEVYEETEIRPIFKQHPLDPTRQVMVGEEEVTVQKGRWNWETVPVQRCAWDPRTSTRVQDSPWFRHRTMATKNELLKLQQQGYLEDVEKIAKNEAEIQSKAEKDREAERINKINERSWDYAGGDEGTYQLDEWYADLTWEVPILDEDGNKDPANYELKSGRFHFWLVNENKLVKFDFNELIPQRIPYFSFRYSIRPRRLLGKSALHPIRELEIYANNLMGSKQDLIKKAAQNPTFYERGSGLEGRKTILAEKSLIPVLDSSKVKHFPVDVAAIAAVSRELEGVIRLMRETTASNEMSMGLGDADTATEASILDKSSTSRFQAVTELTYHEFYGAMANECFLTTKQFANEGDLWVHDAGIDGQSQPVSLADLEGTYTWMPVGVSTEANKQSKLRNQSAFMKELAEFQTKNPNLFMTNKGVQKRFDFVEFINKELMPSVDIKNGATYWQDSQSPMEPVAATLQRQKMIDKATAEGGGQPRPQVVSERLPGLEQSGAAPARG